MNRELPQIEPHCDPLIPFVYNDRAAPYIATRSEGYRFDAAVRPVRPKVTHGCAPRRGGILHTVTAVASVFDPGLGRIRYAARWTCHSAGSTDTTLVALTPELEGALCPRCTDTALGPCLYRCFAADDSLLYVGSTKDLAQRKDGHAFEKSWWPEVARVVPEPRPTLGEARRAESAAIATEYPRYNARSLTTGAYLS